GRMLDGLLGTLRRLEGDYRDVQDIEFTVQEGRLYLLQTRSAKRTATAALKAAVTMVDEGLIGREEAVARIDPGQLDQLLHPMLDPNADVEVAARGLNASPGAASGKVVFDADTAEELGKAGESVILVRWETAPDDYHGMKQAAGILTAHGGLTSHAAVVARGEGIPCVTGCDALYLEPGLARLNGNELHEGDLLTIDGATGRVILGAVALVPPDINEDFQTVLEWADELRPALEEATSDAMRERIKQLREANPMLGTRGCRLGLMYPEIYEMQVRAIVRAAIAVRERTGDAPLVEIMHPLVAFEEELRRL